MHDSGVDEQEDAGLVPTETLCELLRRAFKLTPEKFSHYEKIVIAHIDKKSPQKVLKKYLILTTRSYLLSCLCSLCPL